MLPDRVSNPGPLTYESGALPIALRGPSIVWIYMYIFPQTTYVFGYNFFSCKGITSLSYSCIINEQKMQHV